MSLFSFQVKGQIDQDSRELALDLIVIVLRDIGCRGLVVEVDGLKEIKK